jgi:hypothetical protein
MKHLRGLYAQTFFTFRTTYVFIPILYMFRAPLCSSSGESIVLIRHLVHVNYDTIWYICQQQLGSHPVAVVQYTFTHKQYREQYKIIEAKLRSVLEISITRYKKITLSQKYTKSWGFLSSWTLKMLEFLSLGEGGETTLRWVIPAVLINYTGCPTRYRTRHFFNNITTNEDITTKFEPDFTSLCKKCERKERTAVQISLQYLHWC